MSATLDDLKRRLNIRSTDTDAQLAWDLEVALAKVTELVYAAEMVEPRPATVDEAILLLASRLYARRNTPEGFASWPDLGIVHVEASDPDFTMLLERREDYTNAGLA